MKIKAFLPFYPTETRIKTVLTYSLNLTLINHLPMYCNSSKMLIFVLLFVDYSTSVLYFLCFLHKHKKYHCDMINTFFCLHYFFSFNELCNYVQTSSTKRKNIIQTVLGNQNENNTLSEYIMIVVIF